MVVDNGELILNDDLNEIEFAEPWRMMLQHIACTDYDLKLVYDRILVASPESTLYDVNVNENLSQVLTNI